MNSISTLLMLALGSFGTMAKSSTELGKPGPLKEPAFGIEFSPENIIVSFAPAGSRPEELVSVRGNNAYRNLMHSYLELCQIVHESQVPPWDQFQYTSRTSWNHLILRPDQSWHDWYKVKILGLPRFPPAVLDHDSFANDTDVAILTDAVGDAKQAAIEILASKHNTTIPARSYIVIAAPSFMWTTIEPRPCDEAFPDCGPPSDDYGWHHNIAVKMAGAVHRNGFRRHFVDKIDLIMSAHAFTWPSPITPAGYAAFFDPRFPASESATVDHKASIFPQYHGSSAIVVEFNNAVLSVWAQRQRTVWTPWGTWTRHSTTDKVLWEQASESMRSLGKLMARPYREPLQVYLTGDAWTQHLAESFEQYLRSSGHFNIGVNLRDSFAASKGAAAIARETLDAYGDLEARMHSSSKSEL